MERELFSQLLLVGRTMLEGFVAAQGDGDAGPTLEQEGRTLRRSEEQHSRRYLSIFGELSISRWVYAEREGQKIEAAPLDARLSLPAGRVLLRAGRLAAATVREGIVSRGSDLAANPVGRSAERTSGRADEPANCPVCGTLSPPPRHAAAPGRGRIAGGHGRWQGSAHAAAAGGTCAQRSAC